MSNRPLHHAADGAKHWREAWEKLPLHWQQRGAEKPLLAAIWQPELREPGLEVKEKEFLWFLTCRKEEEEVKLGARAC